MVVSGTGPDSAGCGGAWAPVGAMAWGGRGGNGRRSDGVEPHRGEVGGHTEAFEIAFD